MTAICILNKTLKKSCILLLSSASATQLCERYSVLRALLNLCYAAQQCLHYYANVTLLSNANTTQLALHCSARLSWLKIPLQHPLLGPLLLRKSRSKRGSAKVFNSHHAHCSAKVINDYYLCLVNLQQPEPLASSNVPDFPHWLISIWNYLFQT